MDAHYDIVMKARENAGQGAGQGAVLVCGSLYLVGHALKANNL